MRDWWYFGAVWNGSIVLRYFTLTRYNLFVCKWHRTVAVWTQKPFTPLLTRPQGSQGCKKNQIFFLQIQLLSFCAKIAPERHKLWKSSKLKKNVKTPCFLTLFQIFFNYRTIIAHQTSNGMFIGSWRIFWHPWHPWGRINSENISFLIFVFQRHLADFFIILKLSQMSPLLFWHV